MQTAKTLSRLIAVMTTIFGVVFLAAAMSMIFVESIRLDERNFAHRLISIGCYLDAYAVHMLAGIFLLLGVEVILKMRNASAQEEYRAAGVKWKVLLWPDDESSAGVLLLPAFSRLLLVLFFISQLSWYWNHCS